MSRSKLFQSQRGHTCSGRSSRLSQSSQASGPFRRQGAVLVLVAVLLPVMLILSAMAINFAYMDLCSTELYTATDAAARAAGREFGMTRSTTAAITRAKQIASLNQVAGDGLTLSDSDFTFGQSIRSLNAGRYTFDPNSTSKNAVQITAKRSQGAADGPISLMMPSIIGRSSVNLSETAVSTSVEVDIALVLDRSGSMAYAVDEVANPLVKPASAPTGWMFCMAAPPVCRWRNLVDAVNVFLGEVSTSPMDEQVSLSTYNHIAVTDVSLTRYYNFVSFGLAPYTASLCMGATNIGGGIQEGIGSLLYSPSSRPTAAKVIVVMTDGIHNWGTDPIDAAYWAAWSGITIFTVTFANEADIPRMQQVAAIGGGKHYHAASANDLTTAFQDIARSLPTLLTK